MLTAGDALTKTLAKSQKVTFWSQKMALDAFFLLTAVDALMILNPSYLVYVIEHLEHLQASHRTWFM